MDERVCELCGKPYSKEVHNYIAIDNYEIGGQIKVLLRVHVCGDCLGRFLVLRDVIFAERKARIAPIIKDMSIKKQAEGKLDTGTEKDKGGFGQDVLKLEGK